MADTMSRNQRRNANRKLRNVVSLAKMAALKQEVETLKNTATS